MDSMKKTTLLTGSFSYMVDINDGGMVVIAKQSLGKGSKKDLFAARGGSIEANLIMACRDAGLTDGDILLIAKRLRISLDQWSILHIVIVAVV